MKQLPYFTYYALLALSGMGFARQRWRAWIETTVPDGCCGYSGVRPSAMAGVD